MSLGERLYKLRKKKNLSQEEVADRLNVTRQTISKWETDQSVPDFDKILPLCNLYNISTNELLTGEEETKNSIKNDNGEIRIKRAKTISISVLLYFISIICIIIGEKYIDEQILVGIFLLICGISTSYLIYNLTKLPKAQESRKDSKYKRIDSIVSIIFTLIYLSVSFITMAWNITWLIWLVFAVVVEITHIIYDMKEDENNEHKR